MTNYIAGRYYIKTKGRGLKSAMLTKAQAKALFEFKAKGMLEIEGVSLDSMEALADL